MRHPTYQTLLTSGLAVASALGCEATPGTSTPEPPGDAQGATLDAGGPEGDAATRGGTDAGPRTEVAMPSWVTPPTGCAAPAVLPADPLALSRSVALQGAHMLDLHAEPASGRVYAAGTSGLRVIEDTGAALVHQGKYPSGMAQYEHLAVLDDRWVFLSGRGSAKMPGKGLHVVDAANAAKPVLAWSEELSDLSGLAVSKPTLYVLSYQGEVHTYEISTPASPKLLGTTPGLASPLRLVVGDGVAYVADLTLGLVTLSLADPSQPAVLGALAGTSGIQDVALDASSGRLFGALGSRGVASFDVSNPSAPVLLDEVSCGTSAVAVSAAAGVAWAVTQEQVVAVDAANPAALLPLGTQTTPYWAMNVQAFGGHAYVADWSAVERYELDLAALAPDADPSSDELFFTPGTTSAELVVTNRGGAELVLSGASIDDPRFTVEATALTVAPRGVTTLRVSFSDDGEVPEASLCLATNDPDAPTLEVSLSSTSGGSQVGVGEDAPAFVLPDVDGTFHALDDQLGHPVVLVYFATW